MECLNSGLLQQAIYGRVSGSNSDSKLIASGVADSVSSATFAITPPQRGLCRGRQLSLNVVDIESCMRAHNQFSGIEADLDRSSSSSSSSSSSDSSDVEETHAQAAGLASDGQVSAASEGQLHEGNIPDILAAMLHDFCNAFPTLLHE